MVGESGTSIHALSRHETSKIPQINLRKYMLEYLGEASQGRVEKTGKYLIL